MALDLFHLALAQDSFEQDSLVRHMLIDNPQTLLVHRQDEGIAQLSQRPQRSQATQRWPPTGFRTCFDACFAAGFGASQLFDGGGASVRLPVLRSLARRGCERREGKHARSRFERPRGQREPIARRL